MQELDVLVNVTIRESNFAMLERYVHGDSTSPTSKKSQTMEVFDV